MAKKKSSVSLASKVAILKIPPEAWDAIIPHSHKVSQYLVEYMAAGVVRDISAIVKNKEIKSKLFSIGQEMARVGSQGLIQGWEDGDDICPPWPPFPFPWPWWDTKVNGPEPDPWNIKSIEQLVLADLLVSLAEITTHVESSDQLRETAYSIVKVASENLLDDFEKNKVRARKTGD